MRGSQRRTPFSYLEASWFQVSSIQETSVNVIHRSVGSPIRLHATCPVTRCRMHPEATTIHGSTSALRASKTARRWLFISKVWLARESSTRWASDLYIESVLTLWNGKGAKALSAGAMKETFKLRSAILSRTLIQVPTQPISPGLTLTHSNSLLNTHRSWCVSLRTTNRSTSIARSCIIAVRGGRWKWLHSQPKQRCWRREKS